MQTLPRQRVPSLQHITRSKKIQFKISLARYSLYSRIVSAKQARPYTESTRVAAQVRRGNPRPDASVIQERRSEVARGGSDRAVSPSNSLLAVELQAQRLSPEHLRGVKNRFPIEDKFALPDGRSTSSSHIMSALSGHIVPERLAKIQQVVSGRTFSIIPVLEGINDRGNIGAVARSADAMGFGALHYVKSLDPSRMKTGSGKRTSGGSQKWLDMQVWDSIGACLRHLKAAGYFIAATHLAPDSVAISELDWTVPTVIVMGNESYDQPVIIPQAPGFVDSFNVSVAAALSLYEARTSRTRLLGRNGDLTEEQQQILTAAMLLRHKGSPWGKKFMDGDIEEL